MSLVATRALVEEVLDRTQATDRVYHHLRETNPLVVELLARLREAQPAPARVLIIGPNIVLLESLVRLGYDAEVWQFPPGHLSEDLQGYVRRTVTPEQLASGAEAGLPPLDGEYDAILLPLILESLPSAALPLLAYCRRALKPAGSLLVATTNVARLDLRLKALVGSNLATSYPSFYISFSWPPLPRLRYYHRDELLPMCRKAGLRVRELTYGAAREPFTLIAPMNVLAYSLAQAGHLVQRALPGTRDVLILHLSPRIGDRETQAAETTHAPGTNARSNGAVSAALPTVSVILAAVAGAEALRHALLALTTQDYPPDRFQVLVLHEGSPETSVVMQEFVSATPVQVRGLVATPAEGPAARNAAMTAAGGTLCVHTDDRCQFTPAWLRAHAGAFDESAGVVVGPVLDTLGSYPAFLTLPSSRPRGDYQGLYPIANVSYRRVAALAVGGFTPVSPEAPRALGWDSELGWRVQQAGWDSRFQREAYVQYEHPWPSGVAWLHDEWRLAQELPAAVARVADLRRELLTARVFAAKDTLYFDVLVAGAGLAVARRKPGWLLLGLPWLTRKLTYLDLWPVSRWPFSAGMLGTQVVRHAIWLAGLAGGSARARNLVL